MESAMSCLDASAWIDRLERALHAARSNPTADEVHDLRVAAARLSVWLEVGGRRTLRDDLRWLRSAAAEVRDLDVMIEKHAATEWGAVLHHERAARAQSLAKAALSSRTQGLITGLRAVPAPTTAFARERLSRMRNRFERAGNDLEHDPFDAEALHRVRRRARRLRYSLEWLSLDARSIEALQSLLGHLQNLAVEDRHLAEHASGDEHARAREAIAAELAVKRAAALESWRRVKSELEVSA